MIDFNLPLNFNKSNTLPESAACAGYASDFIALTVCHISESTPKLPLKRLISSIQYLRLAISCSVMTVKSIVYPFFIVLELTLLFRRSEYLSAAKALLADKYMKWLVTSTFSSFFNAL